MEKQLGGQRLGSGSKAREMSVYLHNYERSTFNQSRKWQSTLAPGTLVPFFKEIGTNGDKFDIDLSLMCRTLPTIAPLFGTFKLQLDVFACPVRLYNGLLHNNAVKIGLNMDKVLFPTLEIAYNNYMGKYKDNPFYFAHPSSLMAYLGNRSAVTSTQDSVKNQTHNALSILAYYDIYKNYYANKQETNAYVVGLPNNNSKQFSTNTYTITACKPSSVPVNTDYQVKPIGADKFEKFPVNTGELVTLNITMRNEQIVALLDDLNQDTLTTDNLLNIVSKLSINGSPFLQYATIDNISINRSKYIVQPPEIMNTDMGIPQILEGIEYKKGIASLREQLTDFSHYLNITFHAVQAFDLNTLGGDLTFDASRKYSLIPFNLGNIDTMRIDILKTTGLAQAVNITKDTYLPYGMLATTFESDITTADKEYKAFQPCNAVPMFGLAIKTYQSDMNNNWLNAQDVLNYVTKASEVQVVNGSFDIDSLLMAKKVYNLLNRIVVSGSTWTDWQEAVYSEDAVTRAETPIYVGGMSADITFEEVVSTSAEALGSLAGKGNITNVDGGHIVVNCNEPMLILGIASITPRISYSQNNWWFNSLRNLDELHKPAFDGISYQDKLISDFVGYVDYTDDQGNLHQKAVGKQPAWLHYMTAIDEIYGSFAVENELNYMTLDRRYQVEINETLKDINVIDATTYIDPSRYLYAFQGQRLEDSQVFWLQVGINCQSRRKMSARQMPQL